MNSAGNDIVALAAIDKQRTRHHRFYSKILSDAEQILFDGLQPEAMPFENFVWLLWSIKESIYKYLKRTQPGLVFSPTRIEIRKVEAPDNPLAAASEETQWEGREVGSGKDFYKGIAFFDSRIFYFRSRIHPDFIATIVNKSEDFGNIWWGVRSIGHSDYHNQSTGVRAFVLDKLNAVLSAGKLPGRTFIPYGAASPEVMPVPGTLQIGKSLQGYPLVLKGAEEMTIPLSFAHHANFVAYSFYLDAHLQ